ncbi:MAG: site-specific DNA-methyltransferase [Patescibacteria group bacterium]|nr:site-specific DNA-methyltransferase [Patescibacteria group bacterium]MDE2438183.1 site-specific DNA-methyltransferase [Patescibacteria group bacterium]
MSQTQEEKKFQARISELETEIKKLKKRKKYGLVWEEKPEQVVESCKEKLPVFSENKDREIKAAKNEPTNILIEGDNYDSLSVLNYSHEKNIDLIYIDPPYNTGNKDFIYNDRYIDLVDTYRHSKWLSFMEKRLRLARNLLKETGVVFISIDDNEFARLKLLCDEIFGEKNFVTTITIQVNKGGRDYLPLAVTHEYILCYFKGNAGQLNELSKEIDFELEDTGGKYELRELRNRNPKFSKKNRPNLYYPIYVSPMSKDGNEQCIVSLEKSKDFNVEVFPLNSKGEEGCWRWGRELTLKNLASSTDLSNIVGRQRRDGGWNIYEKSRKATTKAKSIWDETGVRTEQGTIDLRELGMANLFDHPKPVYLIKKMVRLATKEDSVILDFMAGSGTTGQAVLELNKEDGGTRKFILCTNNENKIAEEVCYLRIKKVIEGYKNPKNEEIAGLGGNLKYYKTDFVDAEPTDKNKKMLVDKSTEMLCLKEDCFDVVKKGSEYKLFKNSKDKYLGIIYDDTGIEPFKSEIKKLNKKATVYVFSLDESAREEEFENIANLVEPKPIPAAILNVYKRIFK